MKGENEADVSLFAEAGGEAVRLLQLAKLAGPIIIMVLLPAGGRRCY
jgi:hypothetical protein